MATTGAYRTTSIYAIQVIAGLLTLDLEARITATKQRLRAEKILAEELVKTETKLLDELQVR